MQPDGGTNAGGSVDTSDRKTVVFGLDGACFELIEPWLDAGALPTLAGLIDAGGQTALESCVPATTPPAWTSLTTGVNPGKHGVFGFYGRRRGSYDTDPVSDVDVRARRLWDYTTEADLTSLVVNVPVTHPPREIDGALVPGYLSPDPPSTYPDGLLADLGLEEYRVYADSEATDVSEAQLRDEWLALTDSRRELTLALMERYEWDLLFVEFQKTDGAVHKFDDEVNIRRVFERVDDCMASILESVNEEPNVFVVSDHGIGQQKKWSVALNTWLVEQGYAATTVGSAAQESWLAEAATGIDEGPKSSDASDGAIGRVLSALSRVGVTKQRLERGLSTVGLYEFAARLAPAGAGDSFEEEVVDEAASRAFYQGTGFSGVDTGVTLNAESFYADGVVSEADYESLREELMEALRNLEGPDGQRPFSSVQPRKAVYEGPAVEYAPDIVLEQSADYVIGSSQPRGQTFIPADEGRIDHTRNGLLVAAGPDIESGWELSRTPPIVDVTPTLLALYGVPLAERFDGKPLLELFDDEPGVETLDYGPMDRREKYGFSDEEERALEERLGAMGYME